MFVKNTKATRTVQQVVSSIAIEDMYLSKSFIKELLKVSKGEKSSEQLRQEVLSKYAISNAKFDLIQIQNRTNEEDDNTMDEKNNE